MKKICFFTFLLLTALVLAIYSINFYFLSRLSNQISNSSKSRLKLNTINYYDQAYDNNNINEHDEQSNDDQIKLKPIYRNRNPKYNTIRDRLIKNYTPCSRNKNFSQIWNEVDSWSKNTTNEIYPAYSPLMCQALSAMREVPIIFAQNARHGTQLKLNLTVEGNKTILFKPAWYSRNHIIEGEVYAGKDRHNSEVLAFFLGAVLNLRWTSIVVGRSINVRDIFDVADKELQETIISKHNGSKLCVYGKCFYCKVTEAVCGNRSHYIEGAFLYEIPGSIQKHKSPWQRTYKDGQNALWQSDNNYCHDVKRKLSPTRILDLIDASIFDFLIQNGDRHHYETRKNRLLLLDNGKGVGTFHSDFTDILAPLYQCCIVRKTTYARLLLFTGGALTEILKKMMQHDFIHPVITDNHFHAIERRLLKIFTMIEFCRTKHGNAIFQ